MLAVDTTSVALGSIFAEFSKEDMDILFDWIEKMSIIVESGVQSVGPPASYALVWEWGNTRQTKEGPKTTRGTNPNGETVWLSMQAPHGWIAINEPKIWDLIFEEMLKVEFDMSGSPDGLKQELISAYDRIANGALELLQSTVPIDSGDLYDSLEVVSPNDEILSQASDLAEDMISTIGTLNV